MPKTREHGNYENMNADEGNNSMTPLDNNSNNNNVELEFDTTVTSDTNHDLRMAQALNDPGEFLVTVVEFRDRNGCCDSFGNWMWMIFGGGLIFATVYYVVGKVFMFTGVLFPFGKQLEKLSYVIIHPFGKGLYVKKCCDPNPNRRCTDAEMVGNILWFPIGLTLFLIHFVFAVITFCTVICIPFSYQHTKLSMIAFAPFGVYHDDVRIDHVERIHEAIPVDVEEGLVPLIRGDEQ